MEFTRQPSTQNTGIIRNVVYTNASNDKITVFFDTSEGGEIITVLIAKETDYGTMVSDIYYFVINNVYKRVAEPRFISIPGTTVGTQKDLKNVNHAAIINGTVVFYRQTTSGGKKGKRV